MFVTVVIAVAVILAALLTDDYLRRERLEGVEPYVLLLLSAAGGVIMAQANDLIVLFLGLEVLSMAVYVLAAMHRRRVTSQEAGIKYFVLGAFSSAFFLYGIAMIYGGTGTTNLVEILELFSTSVLTEDGLVLAGLALMLVGLGFKVAAVPFHFWTPDVYQGAPSPMVAWMASGVKVAGFAGLIRVFVLALRRLRGRLAADDRRRRRARRCWSGAVLAVVQTDVKRMMAYSSINHAGFVLVGVQAATDQGVEAALFYLATYTFLIAGTFGVITLVGRTGDGHHSLDDYRGLGALAAGAGPAAGRVPVRPGGRAAHVGLLRQVLRDQRRGRRRVGLAGGRGHALVGDLGVPVPAHHGQPVHGRPRRGAGDAAAHDPGRGRHQPGRVPGGHDGRRACGRARSPRRPATPSPVLTASRSEPAAGACTAPGSVVPLFPDRNMTVVPGGGPRDRRCGEIPHGTALLPQTDGAVMITTADRPCPRPSD